VCTVRAKHGSPRPPYNCGGVAHHLNAHARTTHSTLRRPPSSSGSCSRPRRRRRRGQRKGGRVVVGGRRGGRSHARWVRGGMGRGERRVGGWVGGWVGWSVGWLVARLIDGSMDRLMDRRTTTTPRHNHPPTHPNEPPRHQNPDLLRRLPRRRGGGAGVRPPLLPGLRRLDHPRSVRVDIY
jgi:hypothetical protein